MVSVAEEENAIARDAALMPPPEEPPRRTRTRPKNRMRMGYDPSQFVSLAALYEMNITITFT